MEAPRAGKEHARYWQHLQWTATTHKLGKPWIGNGCVWWVPPAGMVGKAEEEDDNDSSPSGSSEGGGQDEGDGVSPEPLEMTVAAPASWQPNSHPPPGLSESELPIRFLRPAAQAAAQAAAENRKEESTAAEQEDPTRYLCSAFDEVSTEGAAAAARASHAGSSSASSQPLSPKAVGDTVEANFGELGQFHGGVIAVANPDGTFAIQYHDGDYEDRVTRVNIRALKKRRRRAPPPATTLPAAAVETSQPKKAAPTAMQTDAEEEEAEEEEEKPRTTKLLPKKRVVAPASNSSRGRTSTSTSRPHGPSRVECTRVEALLQQTICGIGPSEQWKGMRVKLQCLIEQCGVLASQAGGAGAGEERASAAAEKENCDHNNTVKGSPDLSWRREGVLLMRTPELGGKDLLLKFHAKETKKAQLKAQRAREKEKAKAKEAARKEREKRQKQERELKKKAREAAKAAAAAGERLLEAQRTFEPIQTDATQDPGDRGHALVGRRVMRMPGAGGPVCKGKIVFYDEKGTQGPKGVYHLNFKDGTALALNFMQLTQGGVVALAEQ